MKKGTLLNHEAADLLAEYYVSKGAGTTIFMVPVRTDAEIGEIARFSRLGVERKVLAGRDCSPPKVLLFGAEEWQTLRGTKPAAARK